MGRSQVRDGRAGWQRAARLISGVDTAVFDDLVSTMRVIFFRFLLLVSVLAFPLLLTGEAPVAWRVAGGIALTGLVAWWRHGHRRGGFPVWALVPEGLGLAVTGIAVGDPPRALGVLYLALYFRGFFGTARSAAAMAVTVMAAHLGAVAAASALGFAPAATTLAAPGVLTQLPGFALTTVMIRMLVAVATRREEDVRRRQVLADVGAALGAAARRVDLARAACDGAVAFIDPTRVARVAVAFREDAGLRVAASTDPSLVGTMLELTDAPGLGREVLRWAMPAVLAAGDGPATWPDTTVMPLVVDGAVAGALLVGTTERGLSGALTSLTAQIGLALARVNVAHEVQTREARFRSLVANATDVIRVLDACGTIVHESEPVRHVLGYDPGQLIGRSAFELMHPNDVDEMRTLFDALHDCPSDAVQVADCRVRHADGSWRHLEGAVRNLLDDPAVQGYVVNYRDITQRRELEAELRHRALHDPLTELPNRALFHDRVAHALRARKAEGGAVAVIFVDLDDFKMINDGLGHGAGDAVLKAVGARLRDSVRPSDTCARLGGDEFGVLLTSPPGPAEVHEVSNQILEAVRRPVPYEGGTVDVDASLGIVVSTGEEVAEDLIRNADLAMYRAKSSGKGHYEVFEAGMHEVIRTRIKLRADLERGVAAQEFVAAYQPIVELASDDVVGVEALVRWRHPERGLLAPADFLALAEETGLIVPIGRQVMAQACRDAAAWTSARGRPLHINVNLSAPELQDPSVTGFLSALLGEYDVDPHRLIVEITESMLMVDTDTAATTLERLARLGVRVALDDFGTGFSSLAYLQRFPVDVVKIDKTFVDSLGGGSDEFPLAGAILALGRSLGLAVTAEGVEHGVQLARLRELRCERAQGFFLSEPLPAAAAQMFIRARAGAVPIGIAGTTP